MTQEELDALMAEGFDDESSDEPLKEEKDNSLIADNENLNNSSNNDLSNQDESSSLDKLNLDELDLKHSNSQKQINNDDLNNESSTNQDIQINNNIIDSSNYRVSLMNAWPPPPPTDDHKMVMQLDDVTKDSEEKATQVFDKLDSINNVLMDSESLINSLQESINKNIELFSKLNLKFPNISAFCEILDTNKTSLANLEAMLNNIQIAQDEIMMTMDIMQYQDIHRQKIERVINVMRALSRYMGSLFEGKIDDKKRVSSAVHIEGDSTLDVVSNDDIEALIESLGAKK